MPEWKQEVRELLETTRARTLELVDPVTEEDLCRQLRSYLSPLVWDLGHIANFEEAWLVRAVGGDGVRPDRDGLYDPFRNPRRERAELDLPTVRETFSYLDEVRARTLETLERLDADADPLVEDGFVYRMVVSHEGQHQETMLQALDLPEEEWIYGGCTDSEVHAEASGRHAVDDEERVVVEAGPFRMGSAGPAWSYDNERPARRVDVDRFAIDRYPVTVRRYREFVEAGGYEQPELWRPEGWVMLQESRAEAPQGWVREDVGWAVDRLGRRVPLRDGEPVQHVSWYEADAFARWAGGRLPTESEWEKAAAWDPREGRRRRYPWGGEPPNAERANLGGSRWAPSAVGRHPAGASAYGVEQLLGDVYEWTASCFEGYPGFRPFPYREYSEPFFDGRYRVLRGASWASHPQYARTSYRNWDLPRRRQIFAGIRLAWDLRR